METSVAALEGGGNLPCSGETPLALHGTLLFWKSFRVESTTATQGTTAESAASPALLSQ